MKAYTNTKHKYIIEPPKDSNDEVELIKRAKKYTNNKYKIYLK